ncbi:SIMPL domain-containing protein [Glacieibacterium megasporae]|uniref:SIMPL domain-containing protein n=1 Tax=Glacieibacterium megasporae TaxID=2835787 RepID=UPI001C1DD338|nr:SIMPL domain-containing protein [Polymorphobacter megasporae]UAJ11689.1 SIMPL domain-containing protein [Polymorphobacter megasporae]
MKRALVAAALLIGGPAVAQVPPAELGQRFVPAPWWMREPVVASLGEVRTEVPANRASFSAQFSAVEHDVTAASNAAAKRVRELDQSLRALGAERVQLTTTFRTRPLYDQYREKDGKLVDNERADKIDRYEVTAVLSVAVRDMAVLERAYRTVVAAKPTSIAQVYFSLEPDNATKTWLQGEAAKDALHRARLSVEASGGRLGAPKIVDLSGGVCQTQVFAGWPSYVGGSQPTDVERPNDIRVSGRMMMAAPAPPPPPPPAPSLDQAAETVQITLQPPMERLQASACVVYALLP